MRYLSEGSVEEQEPCNGRIRINLRVEILSTNRFFTGVLKKYYLYIKSTHRFITIAISSKTKGGKRE